jgi:protein-S-isoprenylcysteine O-methyltransferase Ste14
MCREILRFAEDARFRVLVLGVQSFCCLDSHSGSNASPYRRRASDWVGFFAHASVAVLTVVRAPALTVFLLPGIVHMLVAAGSFLVRDQARRRETDPIGRVVSYVGGFGVYGFVQYASLFQPEWLALTTSVGLALTALALGLLGIFIQIWAVWHLRFAFATEPAARRLITTGPYRLARHPIYSGGCLSYLGLIMSHPTWPLALALAGWAVCIRLRMRYEEAILTRVFPDDYAEYRRRVSALVPLPAMLNPRPPASATARST